MSEDDDTSGKNPDEAAARVISLTKEQILSDQAFRQELVAEVLASIPQPNPTPDAATEERLSEEIMELQNELAAIKDNLPTCEALKSAVREGINEILPIVEESFAPPPTQPNPPQMPSPDGMHYPSFDGYPGSMPSPPFEEVVNEPEHPEAAPVPWFQCSDCRKLMYGYHQICPNCKTPFSEEN